MSGLRSVRDHARKPDRHYVDFVVREPEEGLWLWACMDPIHADGHASEPVYSEPHETQEAAEAERDAHRLSDDQLRRDTTCTCKPCAVHGSRLAEIDRLRFDDLPARGRYYR